MAMDVLELIAEVLCRISLPDRDVYPAMARYRDQPTSENEENLLRILESAVRQGLCLPDRVDFWRELAAHPAFRGSESYKDALLKRTGRQPCHLFSLLEKATTLLRLKDRRLEERLESSRYAAPEQLEEQLVPAFLQAAQLQLGLPPVNVWLALLERPELKDIPIYEQLTENFVTRHFLEHTQQAYDRSTRLRHARQRAYLIRRALGEDPEPPNLDDPRDGGSPVPRSPQGPKPTLRHQQKPPSDAPPG